MAGGIQGAGAAASSCVAFVGLVSGKRNFAGHDTRARQSGAQSFEVRGDNGVGWSLAYRAVLWARLGDGDHAEKLVRKALDPAGGMEIRYDGGGGVYPNLFDACPPFQIDGNFGTTAAIAEMLLQSGSGEIHLLPALPGAWADGSVTGLRTRGGFEVSMTWKSGQLVFATIHSTTGEPCRVSYAGQSVDLKIQNGNSVRLNGHLKAL